MIPHNVTGCETTCYCNFSNVTCQATCPPVSALPPSSLNCPANQAILAHLPDHECCKHWICNHTIHTTPGNLLNLLLPFLHYKSHYYYYYYFNLYNYIPVSLGGGFIFILFLVWYMLSCVGAYQQKDLSSNRPVLFFLFFPIRQLSLKEIREMNNQVIKNNNNSSFIAR